MLCSLFAGEQARAVNVGNTLVTANQSTSCAQLSAPNGTFYGIFVTSFKSTTSGTTSYWITFPNNVKGFTQPQYGVLRIDQVGNATSGTAAVFNNSFLGGFIGGTWTGNFSIDGFANFVISSVSFAATNGSCEFTLTKGFAIFVGS